MNDKNNKVSKQRTIMRVEAPLTVDEVIAFQVKLRLSGWDPTVSNGQPAKPTKRGKRVPWLPPEPAKAT